VLLARGNSVACKEIERGTTISSGRQRPLCPRNGKWHTAGERKRRAGLKGTTGSRYGTQSATGAEEVEKKDGPEVL